MTPGKKRQAAYRARMLAEGRRQYAFWLTDEQAQAIRAYLAGDSSLLTGQTPEPERPEPSTPPQPEPEASPKVRFVPVEPSRPERLRQYEVHQGDDRIGHVWQTMVAGRKQWQGFPSGFNNQTYTGSSRHSVVERIRRYRQL